MPDVQMLIDAQTIAAKVLDMARQIKKDYTNKDLVMVPVLTGSFVFAADLMRGLDIPLEVDFLGTKSYGDETISSGVIQITQDLSRSIRDRDILLVEDIVDTGLTMNYLLENLSTRSPRSIKLAVLLSKPAHTQIEIPIDYLGFTIGDDFVVGYGLDCAERYRNLPFIGIVSHSVDD